MNVAISESWKSILSKEFEKSYFSQLMSFVRSEYKHHTCYPEKNEIFAAFVLPMQLHRLNTASSVIIFMYHEWIG